VDFPPRVFYDRGLLLNINMMQVRFKMRRHQPPETKPASYDSAIRTLIMIMRSHQRIRSSQISSSDPWDVIVLGSGFSGSAIAYYCARLGARVLVLDSQDLASGSSSACAGRVQLIESHPGDYLDLVLAGHNQLQNIGVELGVDLEWHSPGHLTLIPDEQRWQSEQKRVQELADYGIEVEMLDRKALEAAEPCLAIQGLQGASLSPEGHINPFKFCFGYINAACQKGTVFEPFTAAIGFEFHQNRVIGVETLRGKECAGVVVVAGGAWSGEILAQAGIAFPMHFTHAEAMVTECVDHVLYHHISLAGFYEIVHDGDRTVAFGVGQHPNGTLVISNAIQQVETANQKSSSWSLPALATAFQKFFPRLKNIRIARTWAAPSPFLPDRRPALGWVPGVENLYVAAGFHLAIPTIPILCEKAAREIINQVEEKLLLSFRPERFVKD
jgi:sarcosine oxidase subunit beta